MKIFFILGLLILSSFANAGGTPSRLNAYEGTLPKGLNSDKNYMIQDKWELIRFLQSSFKELKDTACMQNMLTSPGHTARKALGYDITSVGLRKLDSKISIWVEYVLPDGGSGRSGNYVSNGFPSIIHECELKTSLF